MSPEPQRITSEAAVLARCVLFQALDDDARRELAALAIRRHYSPGQAIFHMGDQGDSMMAVLSGVVRVSVPTKAGREVVLADMMPGEILGEIAMLDGGLRSADAVAQSKCELLIVERRHALPFLTAHPETSLRLLSALCARVRKSDGRMLDLAFLEIPARLAKVLLATGQRDEKGRERLSLSQTELANMIGATRENVNRHLKDWQRQGIVDRQKGWIVLLAPDLLRSMADAQ